MIRCKLEHRKKFSTKFFFEEGPHWGANPNTPPPHFSTPMSLTNQQVCSVEKV